jgi:arylsulfatase
MDPMEKVTPDSKEWQYEGRKFMAAKLWAPTAAGPFLAAHLKSLQGFPKKTIDETMKKMENPGGSSN